MTDPAAGSVVPPGSLRQNDLVEREIRDRSPEPGILGLELLEALHLIELEAAKLPAPVMVGGLGDSD